MNKLARIAPKQLAILMTASLLTDAFIQPFGRLSTIQSAQFGIVGSAVQLIIFAVLFYGLCHRGSSILQSKPATGLLAVVLLISSALEIIQGERFYSYVMQSKLSVGIFLVIVFLAAFYGVYSGLDALSRTATIVLALTLFSIVMLAVSIFSQLHFTNLQPVVWQEKSVVQAVVSQLYLPPELFFWAILLAEKQNTANTHLKSVLSGLFATSVIFSLLGEMTLGKAYQQQEQPLFTIARLGGISVFRRLDAMHISVWLLLFLIKITLYFSMLVLILQKLFPCLQNRWPYYLCVTLVLGIFLIAWSQAENTAYWVQQGLLAVLLLFVFLIPQKQRRGNNETN